MNEPDYEGYASGSAGAFREAQKFGGTVVLPSQYELQLDLDSESAVETFKANLPYLEKLIPVKHFSVGPSRTKGKYHATIELTKPLTSPMERILLQACLGSDPKRELLGYGLLLKRDPNPTLFIEGGRKPSKEEKHEEFNMVSLKPFSEVKPDDVGSDYIGTSGKVFATGTYDHLKKYDTTGACFELTLDPDSKSQLEQMVAVKMEDGDTLLYVYGTDGFGVYV